MADINELLEALERAARTNQRDEFDRHEAKLLARFGGFHGMPRDIYERYVEVDRAWPASLRSTEATASNHVTRLPLHVRVPDELIKQGLKAGDWVRAAAEACGGSGGGRPDLATAGGKDPDKSDKALEAARKFAEEALG